MGYEVAVQVRGVGVGDDDVGAQLSSVGQDDPGRRVQDAAHRGPEPHLHAEVERAFQQRLGDPVQATFDVPAPLLLLDVGDRCQRRGGQPRVGAGVGRVTVEQDAKACVAQVAPTQGPEGPTRSEGGQVAGVPQRQRRQRARAVQRALQERSAAGLPDATGPLQEGAPVGARAGAQGGVKPVSHLCEVVGAVEPGAVGETVPDQRVEPLQHERRRPATGRGEKVPEDLRHRQQRRPGVEAETGTLVAAQLAADLLRGLQHGHPMSAGGQSAGSGQTSDSRADHDDPAHTARPFHRSDPRRRASRLRASRATRAATPSGCVRLSRTRPPVRCALTARPTTPAA